jgi:hypothetical protein
MDSALFWVCWGAIAGLVGWHISQGLLQPARMLEWPFLACAMWGYFFVYMAMQAKTTLGGFMSDWVMTIGEFVPLLCLIGILLGWKTGIRRRQEVSPSRAEWRWPIGRLWVAGMCVTIFGAFGAYSVVRAATLSGGQLDYGSATAYWYLLFLVGYPGMALSLWAICKVRGVEKAIYLWFFVIVMVTFMFPHIYNARRGPLFPAVLILLFIPPLARRKSPKAFLFLAALGTTAVLMFLFLQVRQWTYKEGTWTEAMESLTTEQLIEERTTRVTDNEFVNNCHTIVTLLENGKYQLGTGHLELLVHWIPRKIWPGKPMLGEGSYSFEELFHDVEIYVGIDLLSGGASAGGVAESFVQYGFFCPLFWFGLSWLVARIFVRARSEGDPRWQLSYVGFLGSTHWLISQSFPASLVPCLFFVITPLCVLQLFVRFRQRSASEVFAAGEPAPFRTLNV